MTRHKNVEKGLGTFLGLSPFWFIHSIVTRRSSTAIKNNTWMKRIQPITLYFTKMPANREITPCCRSDPSKNHKEVECLKSVSANRIQKSGRKLFQ